LLFSSSSFFPKLPKLCSYSCFFSQNSMAMVLFFLVETLKSSSWSFSWFFPKFPKSSYFSWPYLQSHGLLLGFFQSSMVVVFLCYFWLLVNMPIVLFNSLIICSFKIFKLSPPYPPHFSILIIKGKEGGEGGGG
jgi:hypothetical protein